MKMNMKLKRILTIFVTVVLYTATASAQRVINEDGKIMIDASGIANATKPDGNRAQIYNKFEVAKADVSGPFGMNTILGEAIPACHDMGKGKGEWRLPTYQELMLILMLRTELIKNGLNNFILHYYWFDTAIYGFNCIHFRDGISYNQGVNHIGRGRCIREIKPLPASK